MALQIYDMVTDDYRPVTQADIDELTAFRRAYARIRTAMTEAHAELVDAVKTAKQSVATDPAVGA